MHKAYQDLRRNALFNKYALTYGSESLLSHYCNILDKKYFSDPNFIYFMFQFTYKKTSGLKKLKLFYWDGQEVPLLEKELIFLYLHLNLLALIVFRLNEYRDIDGKVFNQYFIKYLDEIHQKDKELAENKKNSI